MSLHPSLTTDWVQSRNYWLGTIDFSTIFYHAKSIVLFKWIVLFRDGVYINQSTLFLWQNGKWLRQYLNTFIRSTSSIEVFPRSIQLCWIEKWELYCHIFSSHKCWLDWQWHHLWLNFQHPKCGQSLIHVLAQSWRRD